MNQLLKQMPIICMCLFALTGQADAEPLSKIETAAILSDCEAVAKLTRLQAEQGNAIAQAQLGDTYHKGKGVLQDYKEALKWYRLAAEQGNSFAQYGLGFMYSRGEGVPKDYVLAHMWANISAANIPRAASNAAIAGIEQQQVRKDSAVSNLLDAVDMEAAAKGVIEESAADREDRELNNRIAAFAPARQLINDSITRIVQLTKRYAQQADALTALEQDDSFLGKLNQMFNRDDLARDLNETVDAIKRQKAIRDSLIAAGEKVNKFQLSLIPTKTPEQMAAEAELLVAAAQEAKSKVVITDASDREANFNSVVAFNNDSLSGTPQNFEQLVSAGLRDSLEEQMTVGQIAEAQELARKCTANKFKGC